MSHLTILVLSISSLVIVIFVVAKISRTRGVYESALKESQKSLGRIQKYIKGTRRPIFRGSDLVDRMREWSKRSD